MSDHDHVQENFYKMVKMYHNSKCSGRFRKVGGDKVSCRQRVRHHLVGTSEVTYPLSEERVCILLQLDRRQLKKGMRFRETMVFLSLILKFPENVPDD